MGAYPSSKLVEVEETPLAYHPENATKLKAKVGGKMNKAKGRVLINRFFLLLFIDTCNSKSHSVIFD